MRTPAAVLSILVTAALPSAAQDSLAAIAPNALCFHAKPKPACAAFMLTNVGVYGVAGGDFSGRAPLMVVVDWGVMGNVGTRTAIGASVFVSVDEGGAGMLGSAVRYGLWISPRTSLEFAVGTALLGEAGPGSILGLVRWSPAPWFALTARPEMLRRDMFLSVDEGFGTRSRGRLSIGLEAVEVPGLILTGAGGAALLVLALLSGPTEIE